ncbi:hypothetical protein Tco_0420882 [Tanacetum coccineum]
MIAMDFLLVRYVEHRTLCQLCGKWTDGREREFLASATSTGAGDDDTLDLRLEHIFQRIQVLIGMVGINFSHDLQSQQSDIGLDIDMLSSDHSPSTPELKLSAESDF